MEELLKLFCVHPFQETMQCALKFKCSGKFAPGAILLLCVMSFCQIPTKSRLRLLPSLYIPWQEIEDAVLAVRSMMLWC